MPNNAKFRLFLISGNSEYNLFAYCSNNQVNATDATGEDWYHWAIAVVIVVALAVAVVTTEGPAYSFELLQCRKPF